MPARKPVVQERKSWAAPSNILKAFFAALPFLTVSICYLLINFNDPFNKFSDLLKKVYTQEYLQKDKTNQMRQQTIGKILYAYENIHAVFPDIPEECYLAHIYIMKIESDFTEKPRVSRTDDWGICQINMKTWIGLKENFLMSIRKNREFYIQMVMRSDDLEDPVLNVSFSIWYVYQLWKGSKGNIRDVISRYNSGQPVSSENLPSITKAYLQKYDYFFYRNINFALDKKFFREFRKS